MTTAGYSGTPLWKKLGIKPADKIWLINVPDNYPGLISIPITNQLVGKNESPDLVHLFVKNIRELDFEMNSLRVIYKTNRKLIIWVSWHKKASGIKTDVTEDIIRAYALNNGLVDVKVCAVSEIWSGLKLVVPVAKR